MYQLNGTRYPCYTYHYSQIKCGMVRRGRPVASGRQQGGQKKYKGGRNKGERPKAFLMDWASINK